MVFGNFGLLVKRRTINEVDGIATITKEDTDRFSELACEKPLMTIPFGINIEDYIFKDITAKKKNKLFHIGAMNWEPNKEAINWFIDAIWPLVKKEDLSIHLAGREMPGRISDLATDKFVVHGEVASAQEFIANHDIMVVPLLSGSGMRIKIIEGMALGKVVISTSVGAEGIDYKDRENILIANKKNEFIKQISWLLEDKNRIKFIGQNARKLVEKKYNNEIINHQLVNFYQSL